MVSDTETEHNAYAEAAIAAAAWQGIAIPPACIDGVAANLAILRMHMERVRVAAESAPPDPAELLAP